MREVKTRKHPPVEETLKSALRTLDHGHPDPPRHLGVGQKLFVVLGAIFVTCLVLGDVTGGKAFATTVGPVSVGMILFPVTFLLTDVINDFYGKRGARFITAVGAAMATLAYFALVLTTALPTDKDSYFQADEYAKIFGGSSKLFIASIVAYVIGQVLDIQIFLFWKRVTRGRHLWLRATGSTLISQLIDTATINSIFWAGVADKSWGWIGAKIFREYIIKIVVAIALTPIVYAIHAFILRWLGLEPAPHIEEEEA
ncbi:MAG: queuosine precursor transporter [Polyangiaceae bacterium]|nr:queuosine precursor transporter [Polyangiaceae bacterium]